MRITRLKKRSAVILALAAAGAVAVAGIAVANSQSLAGTKFSDDDSTPNTLPRDAFTSGKLFVHTHATYTNPGNQNPGGATDRAQLFFDDDGRTNTGAVPKCDPNQISGATVTLAQAMNRCGSARVGKGTAQAIYDPPPAGGATNTINGCVLVFNGQNNSAGRPTSLVFTRVKVGIPPNNTINCATNGTQGNTSVLLRGIVKPNPADVPGTSNDADFTSPDNCTAANGASGCQVEYPNITDSSPFPLSDFQVNVQAGNYIQARCHDTDHTLNIRGKFTYNDGTSQLAAASQTCTVG